MPESQFRASATNTPASSARDSTLLEELRVERQRGISLVDQIVCKLEQMVESGRLRAGTKTPSVRELAKQLGVSTFTVTEAYDVLVSKRVLSSRPGAGYFVNARVVQAPGLSEETSKLVEVSADAWLPLLVWNQNPELLAAGSGVLPPEWCSESLILQAVRQAIKMPAERLVGYGHPLGFQRLRQLLSRGFTERFCAVAQEQVILTNGVSHGLDLVVRSFLKPGDTVLVEDPTYFNIHHLLQNCGIRMVPVRRTQDGLDVEQLGALAAMHSPKAIFVNTVLHNPLSTTLTPSQCYRIIALAEQYDFLIIEDDIFRDLAAPTDPSLASLDGLNRVVCLGGFSKTVAPSLRIGYILCPARLVSEIVRVKMTCGLTTSELNERCIYEVLSDPGHRRYIERLRLRLSNEREQFLAILSDVGMTPLATPRDGLFVSAGWRVKPSPQFNGEVITALGLEAGIALSRGELFRSSNR
ncbi:PLP-dependent aminotransferase family protein [Paraburkholderia dipogonis]|uniref:aminotransferase-like domain-containing protein n=1 Tax=Paraburkholderia dipogonis TaxID=1211383 RepID=UPI00360B6BD4